eukprot:m.117684 g.117684  ORF g.117684 m.117684 type:complete len:892 (-) comp9216_c0_seq3:143-2818(-)
MHLLAAFHDNGDVVFAHADTEMLALLAEEDIARTDQSAAVDGFHNVSAFQFLQRAHYELASLKQTLASLRTSTTSYVIQLREGVTYIAMSNTCAEALLQTQVLLLRDFILMFALPIVMASASPAARDMAALRMDRLMQTVMQQQHIDHSVLVQACEHIPIQEGRPWFERLLTECVGQLPAAGRPARAMLVAGPRILATWAAGGPFPAHDAFLLALVMQSIHAQPRIWSRNSSTEPDGSMTPMSEAVSRGSETATPMLPDLAEIGPSGWVPDGAQANGRRSRSSAPGSRLTSAHASALDLPALAPGNGLSSRQQSSLDLPALATGSGLSSRQQSSLDLPSLANGSGPGSRQYSSADLSSMALGAAEDAVPAGPGRLVVFLRDGDAVLQPFVLHHVEVDSVSLILLSHGLHGAVYEDVLAIRHYIRECYRLVADGRVAEQAERAGRSRAKHWVVVRGARELPDSTVNGVYLPTDDMLGGRTVYQHAALPLVLFFSVLKGAWCIAADTAATALKAHIEDTSLLPENAMGTWSTLSDTDDLQPDPKMAVCCVRSDGSVRNRDGRWARIREDDRFYCGGATVCTCKRACQACGSGPCNCSACALIKGSREHGATLAPPVSPAQERQARAEAALAALQNLLAAAERVQGAGLLEPGARETVATSTSALRPYLEGPPAWDELQDVLTHVDRSVVAAVACAVVEANWAALASESQAVTALQKLVRTRFGQDGQVAAKVARSLPLWSKPGLLHYVYVDRGEHRVHAPAIRSPQGADSYARDNLGGQRTLKEMVWDFYGYATGCLQRGYTTVMIRRGDFALSYFFWVENAAGPVPLSSAFTPPAGPRGPAFYQALAAQLGAGLACHELLLVNLALMPFDAIAQQAMTVVATIRGGGGQSKA